jgi:hypothetical protein
VGEILRCWDSLLFSSAKCMMTARRLPPPWTVEETPACFIVRDSNKQALAYVYFEDEPGPSCWLAV